MTGSTDVSAVPLGHCARASRRALEQRFPGLRPQRAPRSAHPRSCLNLLGRVPQGRGRGLGSSLWPPVGLSQGGHGASPLQSSLQRPGPGRRPALAVPDRAPWGEGGLGVHVACALNHIKQDLP